jgi:cobalt-zinc-cadmium efflux system outer membrane protein
MKHPRPLIVLLVAALVLATGTAASAVSAAEPSLVPAPLPLRFSPGLDLAQLEALVRARTPALESDALEVDLARAEVEQSRLLGNPTADGAWATIPVGRINPPDLASPLSNVPNYSVGLSYTFPIGKRGPKQERAAALERGAEAAYDAAARERALELARLAGAAATVAVRLEGLRALAADDQRSVALAESRFRAGFATPLDVDRLRIEVSRTQQQILSAESDLDEALASCATLAGTRCQAFADAADARVFLRLWIAAAQPSARIEDRADIRALGAYREAADAELVAARAQAIPDPTLRVGYQLDTFQVSGAQRNSVNLGVSIPLPVFDHGQAQISAASSKRIHYAAQRARRIQAAEARIPALVQRVRTQQARTEALEKEVIPRAEQALTDLARVGDRQLVPLTDVIQARRTLNDLLLDDADGASDAFQAALAVLAETPPAAFDAGGPKPAPSPEPPPQEPTQP